MSLNTFKSDLVREEIRAINEIKETPYKSNEIISNFKQNAKKILFREQQKDSSITNKVGDEIIEESIQKIASKSGNIYKFNKEEEKNKFIQEKQIKKIIEVAVKDVKEQNKDPEDVIDDVEKKLKKIDFDKNQISNVLEKITEILELSEKEDNTEEELLKDSGDYLQLPKLDLELDDPVKQLNLKKETENLIPSSDKKINEDYEKLKNIEDDEESREKLNQQMEKKDSIFVRTENLENVIRQKKICLLFSPPQLDMEKLESIITKYFSSIRYDKFPNIVSFGWEPSDPSKSNYQNFDKLLEYNKKESGALFMLRDIKFFNSQASQLLSNNSGNYYVILIEWNITKNDLIVLENLNVDTNYLWPSFSEFETNLEILPSYTFLTDEHLKKYNSLDLKINNRRFKNRDITESESDKEKLRSILNVYFDNEVMTLNSPGLTLNESISRCPKFRNIIFDTLINSDKRILIKLPEGKYGLDSFEYILNKLKKQPVKPLFIRSVQPYQTKKKYINELPPNGPILVITDHTLTEELIPKNLEDFYICGGGNEMDLLTLNDIMKVKNYPRLKFPRKINIRNFITKLNNEISESQDSIDYQNFYDEINKLEHNMDILKSLSMKISVEGEKLIVNYPNVAE